MFVCVCLRACVCVCLCLCVYMYMYINRYSHNFIRVCIHMYIHIFVYDFPDIVYGVALVSRIDKIIGLFCKRAL